VPAVFGDPQELTRELAELLDESGVFTRVVREAKTPADLELEVTLNGDEFGPGRALFSGSVFSTLAWFFSGIPSWYIDNREYSESGVSLSLVMRHAAYGSGPGRRDRRTSADTELFKDDLFPKDLRLSFSERSGTSDWFLNILLPPWVGGGDSAKAGRSLVLRSSRDFVDNEVPQLLASFPANYILKNDCLLGYDREKEEFVIISRAPLLQVELVGDSTDARVLTQDDLLEVGGSEKDELERWLRERVVGLGTDVTDRYYRIPLEFEERGFVRVQVAVEGRTTPARWTVRTELPPEGVNG